jgi:hypothetical protein
VFNIYLFIYLFNCLIIYFFIYLLNMLRMGNCESYNNISNGLNICFSGKDCVILEGNHVWFFLLHTYFVYLFIYVFS